MRLQVVIAPASGAAEQRLACMCVEYVRLVILKAVNDDMKPEPAGSLESIFLSHVGLVDLVLIVMRHLRSPVELANCKAVYTLCG